MKTQKEMRISSNVDLSGLSNKRLMFESVGNNQYLVTSTLKFSNRASFSSFVRKFLHRNLGIKFVIGCCSYPLGYEF